MNFKCHVTSTYNFSSFRTRIIQNSQFCNILHYKTFRHSDKVSKLQPDNFPYTTTHLNLEMTRTDRQRIIKSFFLAFMPDKIICSALWWTRKGVTKLPVHWSISFPRFSMDLHAFYRSFVNVYTSIYLLRNTHVQSHAKVSTYVHT